MLEVLLVLLIIALLAGAAMVDFSEFFRHQDLKDSSASLQRLARQGSRSASALNLDYRIRFEPSGFYAILPESGDIEAPTELPAGIVLEIRNRWSKKWGVPDPYDWVFPASGIAEPLAVRLTTPDGAYVELEFNPLTGAVDAEQAYFP